MRRCMWTANSPGTIDRRLNQTSLPLHIDSPHARLDILLENTGRVNFGSALPGEHVGLLGGVRLAGKPLTGWENFSLPMRDPANWPIRTSPVRGPASIRRRSPSITRRTRFSTPALWARGWSGSTAGRWGASGASDRRRRCTCRALAAPGRESGRGLRS